MHIDPAMIHPELRRAASLIRLLWPSFTERKYRFAKKANQKLKGRCRSPLTYEQKTIVRPDGSLLRLCIYSAQNPKSHVPGLLWLHGGGYALGTPEQDELFIQRFIAKSNCVVVSPDYRLSIDAPYPAALEDGYAALLWLKENGPSYGVRTDQLMVGGDSAGGGLAVALTLYARDKKEVAIAFQMPLYPMLDDRMATPSAADNDGPLWNSKSNEVSWRLYLGSLFRTDQVPVYAAPARCRDLTGLPPACTYVGSIEPFRDEVIDYFERLRAHGTDVHLNVFEGCFHGFDIVCAKTGIADAARDFLMSHFSYATEHYFAAQPDG
ncbi:MAG: alpha/beta hydrolase [Clostridiales bacterium]|nr:alpha/beta hydrolase [Clostridiales bacterium]MDD4018897.1 alpha/beta hydrolase [Kiritimatiellia bacterium]